VAGDVRQGDELVTLPGVPVRPAHPRGTDPDDDAARRGLRVRNHPDDGLLAIGVELESAHSRTVPRSRARAAAGPLPIPRLLMGLIPLQTR
jgi:hypothetical protein